MGYGLTVNCLEPVGVVYVDQGNNIFWNVCRDSVDLWADDVLVLSVHGDEIRTPFGVSCGDVSGVDGAEALAVGTWTGVEKTLYVRVNGVCVAVIDVLNGVIQVAAVDTVSGVSGSNAPVPFWGRWADSVFQVWDGESGLWETVASVAGSGNLVTAALRVCDESDCLLV